MSQKLVTAAILESQFNLAKSTTYRAARLGLIPSYRVGVKGRGIRFVVEEVLPALRQQVCPDLEKTSIRDLPDLSRQSTEGAPR